MAAGVDPSLPKEGFSDSFNKPRVARLRLPPLERSPNEMKTLVITTALIVIGFFICVGLTLRQKIEAAIHISGKTCFFEIGNGRVSVMSGLGSLPGTGIKHRLVETDPGSPFTDFPDTDTPVYSSEFLRCAFATPYFGSVSTFAIPYWVFALLFLTPVLMIFSERRATPAAKAANKAEISSPITPRVD